MLYIRRIIDWWISTFRKQKIVGKLGLASLTLISLCCICTVPIALLTPSTPTPEATLISKNPPVETATITIKPTDLPTKTPTITLTLLPSTTPTVTITPTITSTLLPSSTPTETLTPTPQYLNLYNCLPPHTPQYATVTKVTDGDTIEVLLDGTSYHLRYIGVDSPESNQEFGAEAIELNSELVLNQQVTLIKDQNETDSFGRLLRYVLVDNVFVNLEMVRKGYASAKSYPPDTACDTTFSSAQATAQQSSIGVWAPVIVPPVRSNPIDIAPTADSRANCDPSYPTVCIPSPPPDLNCGDISYKRFKVLQPDPHNFDGNKDGVGCEG